MTSEVVTHKKWVPLSYVSSYYYLCPHTLYVFSYCYMCPHTTMCVSYYYIYVLILLHMCPHSTLHVCSYTTVCVLILLQYICPHTTTCPHNTIYVYLRVFFLIYLMDIYSNNLRVLACRTVTQLWCVWDGTGLRIRSALLSKMVCR